MRSRSFGQRGYALTWAVMTLVIAALLAAFILPVGLSFSKRSLHSYSTDQAYLTARSAAAAVAANSTRVVGEAYNDFEPKYYPSGLLPAEGHSFTVNGFEFDSDYRMGEVSSVEITRISEEVQRVTAQAEYAGGSSTVSAYLGRRAQKQLLETLPLVPGTTDEVDEVAKAAGEAEGKKYQFYIQVGTEPVLITSVTTYTWEITGYTLDGGASG